jgi:hypothetical protein
MHVPEQSTGTNHMQELSHSTCTPLLQVLATVRTDTSKQ